MSKCLGFAGAGLVVLGLLLASVGGPAAADEAKKDDTSTVKPNPAAEDVANVALAYRLAEYGRKHKSPEMLVSAARILRHVKTTPGKETPKIEAPKGEETPKDEPLEAASLMDESKKMLADAKKLAPDDAIVAELVERAAKEKTRGSLGGPRTYRRALRPGFTNTWGVNFVGHRPASVSVTGNGIAVFTVEAINDGGQVVAVNTGPYPSLNWVPAFTRRFTLRVRNDGGGFSGYTLYHN